MRLISVALGAVSLIALASCATVPAARSVDRTVTVDRSYDEVWTDLVAFFATNSIPIRNIEKASGLIVAEREVSTRGFGAPGPATGFSGMADCGTPGFGFVARGWTTRLNVLARRLDDGRTSVTVTTAFEELRRSDFGSATVDCQSTGALERMVHDRARGLFRQ